MTITAGLAGDQGFTWSGTLDSCPLPSLYQRCAALRFSGRLKLEQGPRAATVEFVGGDAVSDAPDPGDASWAQGSFVLAQATPDLRGELTAGTSLEGSLAET